MNKLYLPSSVFLISQVLFQLIPLCYAYFVNFDESLIFFIKKAFFVNLLALLVFLAFFYIFNIRKKTTKIFVPRINTSIMMSLFVVMMCPLSFVIHYLISGVNPFFVALGDADAIEIAVAREQYIKQLPVYYILMFTIFEKLLPMLFIPVNIALYYSTGKSKFLLLGWLCFIFLFIAGVFNISKLSPIIAFGILAFSIAVCRNLNAIFFFLRVFLIGLFGLGLMGVLIQGSSGTFDQTWLIMQDLFFRRILVVHSFAMTAHFEVFPSQTDFLMGKGIRLFSVLSGDSQFQLANYVFRVKFPDGFASGWLNTGYIGEAWADFGWYGVIAYPLFIAYFVSKVDFFILTNYRRKKSMPAAVFVSLLSCFVVFNLSMSSMLSTTLLIIIFSITILFRIFFVREKTAN